MYTSQKLTSNVGKPLCGKGNISLQMIHFWSSIFCSLVWIWLHSMELRKSHRNRKRIESSSKGPVGEDMWVFLGGVRMYSPNIKTWSEKRYLGLLSEHILGISPSDNWFHRRLVAFQVKLSNLNQLQFIIASRGDHKVSSNSLPQETHQRSLLILSVYPSPSNSHKWRKIGIPH